MNAIHHYPSIDTVENRILTGQVGKDPRQAKGRNIPQVFLEHCRTRSEQVCMRAKRHGIWREYSWREVERNIRALNAGLAGLGLKRGDVLGIISENIVEVYWIQYAALCQGATVTCMYPDSSAEEIEFIMRHAQIPIVLAEDQEQVDKVLSIADGLPDLRHVVYVDDRGLWNYKAPVLVGFHTLMHDDPAVDTQRRASMDARVADIPATDLAMLCYTSGTTGAPKGVMLSHQFLLDNAYRMMAAFEVEPDSNYLSYISPAWGAEQIGGLALGAIAPMVINFAEKPETVQADLRELGAEFLLFTPRQWEMMLSGVQARMSETSPWRQALYQWAVAAGRACVSMTARGPARWWLRARAAMAELLVLRAIRDNLGLTRAKICLSGGSGLSGEVFMHYHALGVRLRNLYGSTEIGLLAAHWGPGFDAGHFNADTMGQLLPVDPSAAPPLALAMAEDGELRVHGGTSFCGYYRNPEASAAVIDADGAYCMGDVVRVTDTGDLVYLDRVKDMRSLAGGHVFPPQFIENRLRANPFIKDVMIVGDETRPYVTALINIDAEIVGKFAERQGLGYGTFAEMSDLPLVRQQIGKAIGSVNALLEPASRVRYFANFPKELDPDDDELTRSRKLRRNVIVERYAPLIEALYDGSEVCEAQVVVRYRDGGSKTITAPVAINSVEGPNE